jgi:hypothetical protein
VVLVDRLRLAEAGMLDVMADSSPVLDMELVRMAGCQRTVAVERAAGRGMEPGRVESLAVAGREVRRMVVLGLVI